MIPFADRGAVLDRLGCQEEGPARNNLHGYLVKLGWLDNEKVVEQWPACFVPITADELEALKVALAEFSLNGQAIMPYQPHGLDPATLPSKAEPAKEPAWVSFVMPFGKSKGRALGNFEKAELEFYLTEFKVRESVDVAQVDGSIVTQPLPPESVNQQKALRAALDEAQAYLAKQPTTKG